MLFRSDFENFFLLISDYAKVGYAKLNLLDRKGYAIKQWYKNMGEDENTQLSWKYGYPAVIVISLVIVMICLWIMKKKKFW